MKTLIFLTIFLISSLEASFTKDLNLSKNEINKILFSKEKTYILQRLKNFRNLKQNLKKETDIKKVLNRVNNFFNKFKSISDKKNYKKSDYWASRKEFLLKGKGDCEDYVIAKYFTLLELGIKKQNLSLIQVSYKKQLHMILTYNKNKIKFVLDNLNKNIISLKQRKDLTALYELQAFNFKKNKLQNVNNLILYKWNKLLEKIAR